MIEEISNLVGLDILKKFFPTEIKNNKLDGPFSKTIVYKNENIIGILNFDLIYDRAEINYIFVEEKHRKKGIARDLINYIINYNVLNISLEVNDKNENAILFYKKMGFQIVTVRKNYYESSDAFLMVKEV